MDDQESGSKNGILLIALAACCAPELLFGLFIFMITIIAIWIGFGGGSLSSGATNPDQPVTTSCGETVSTLVPGFNMMPTTGKLGLEQHLSLKSGQSASDHYAESGTPSYAQNGMAGGYGGLNSGPPTIDNERWYSNTQWYWWINPDGSSNPCLSKLCQEAQKLTPHARIILTNVKTGVSVVTSAEESGPALWVTQQDGRNWGASGEVFHYLSEKTSGWPDIVAGFAKDQSIPLGPCNK